MAPEIHEGLPYGIQADIYSLGVIFYRLLTGKAPYDNSNSLTHPSSVRPP
jgi:serine/threonine protein kinase